MSGVGATAAERRRILERLPDEPLTVETRSLLLDEGTDLWVDPDGGFAVRDVEARLSVVSGRCRPEIALAAVEGATGSWELAGPVESRGAISAVLPAEWSFEEAVILALPPRHFPRFPAPGGARLVGPDEIGDLGHLAPVLRSEIELALGRKRPLVAARIVDRCVSFCYAFGQSESLWDVAIETVDGFRRRGLAAACAARLVREQRTRGREAVWGAIRDNRASLRLAERLGFVPVGRLAVWERVS